MRERFLKRLPFDECRNDVKNVSLLTKLVHRDDIRMPKSGCGLCLAQESFDSLLRISSTQFGDLDGDSAIKLRIIGLIDLAECSFPEFATNFESADPNQVC